MGNLFDIAGETYYFDLDRIGDFIKLEKQEDEVEALLQMTEPQTEQVEGEVTEEQFEEAGQMIDLTKWELTKALIETVLSEQGIVDEAMGQQKLGEQLSIPFRISFNTLLINKILKKR
jgi:hypothetical protein